MLMVFGDQFPKTRTGENGLDFHSRQRTNEIKTASCGRREDEGWDT